MTINRGKLVLFKRLGRLWCLVQDKVGIESKS